LPSALAARKLEAEMFHLRPRVCHRLALLTPKPLDQEFGRRATSVRLIRPFGSLVRFE